MRHVVFELCYRLLNLLDNHKTAAVMLPSSTLTLSSIASTSAFLTAA